jgi:sugar phosphate isomerase/epimerase
MRMCKTWPVSVCSWSFEQEIEKVAEQMKALELSYINLALLPALQGDGAAYVDFVKKQDWTISATMISFPCEDYATMESIKTTGGLAPDAHWEENKRLALDAIDLTAELNTEYLCLHFGFIDHSESAYVSKFYDRTRILADAAEAKGVKFLMETGQETAAELEHFLKELNHPALAVNFDPANMILYDKGVPTDAIDVLAPWVRHIHIKDAMRTQKPGEWGDEVPWGDGEVGATAFLDKLSTIRYQGAVAIEREAGSDRAGDIKLAVERLSQYGESC